MLLASIFDFVGSIGHTSIEVFEWKEVEVRKPRLSNSPDFTKLTTKHLNLAFNGWSLAHAVVKADYLDRRNLTMPGLGFLLQASNIITFGASPIELKPGAAKALNDISLTSLSGRVGQGLAILYGHSLGMKFTAHLRSHVEALPAGSVGAAHKGEAMADFLFANNHQTVLIESKGSFTLKKNNPTSIKSVLKGALEDQIDPWMGYLQPAPSNGYVVYSCLREHSGNPSAIFVVDPVGEDDAAGILPFSCDQVLRENYGAWLRAMGLAKAAERLVRPVAVAEDDLGKPEEIPFLVVEHDGRKYSVRADQPNRLLCRCRYPTAIGLDLAALRALSTAINEPQAELTKLLDDLPSQLGDRQGALSIFPDGSLFGPLDMKPFDREFVRL